MSFKYLCTPYSHPHAEVRARRYRLAHRVTKRYLLSGEHVFSPIVHCHHIAQELDKGKDLRVFAHEFWLKYDFTMISASSGLIIVTAPGWMESKGIQWEIGLADSLHLPTIYAPPEPGEWEGYEGIPDERRNENGVALQPVPLAQEKKAL